MEILICFLIVVNVFNASSNTEIDKRLDSIEKNIRNIYEFSELSIDHIFELRRDLFKINESIVLEL